MKAVFAVICKGCLAFADISVV